MHFYCLERFLDSQHPCNSFKNVSFDASSKMAFTFTLRLFFFNHNGIVLSETISDPALLLSVTLIRKSSLPPPVEELAAAYWILFYLPLFRPAVFRPFWYRVVGYDGFFVHPLTLHTGRESYSRPDKLLRTVNILYDPSLFVSAVGGRVKRLLNLQHMPTVRTVRTIRTDREPIHDPTDCYGP